MAAVTDLRVDMILVKKRLRPISEAKVAVLAESMAVVGLIHPIVIVRPSGVMPELLVGAHRLAAAKALGWETIPCIERPDDTEDRRLLAEIDENLMRSELSPAARAVHMEARKEIHERLHPETKVGGAPGKAGGGKVAKGAKLASFAEDTAAKTGRSKRDVKRDSTRASRIPRIADVVGTTLDKGTELDALANLPPAEQARLIDEAKAGQPVSAKKAAGDTEHPPQPPTETPTAPTEDAAPEPTASDRWRNLLQHTWMSAPGQADREWAMRFIITDMNAHKTR